MVIINDLIFQMDYASSLSSSLEMRVLDGFEGSDLSWLGREEMSLHRAIFRTPSTTFRPLNVHTRLLDIPSPPANRGRLD